MADFRSHRDFRLHHVKVYATDVSPLAEPVLYRKAYEAASVERRQKADRFLRDSDKRLSLGAWLLLRYGLTQAGWKEFPPPLLYGKFGKPFLRPGKPSLAPVDTSQKPGELSGSAPALFFNLSHSGTWALCAIADREVGCDLEEIRPIDWRIADFFHPREREAVFSCPETWITSDSDTGSESGSERSPDTDPGDNSRLELFYRYWTLKESFMKATGLGMNLAPDSFRIILEEERREEEGREEEGREEEKKIEIIWNQNRRRYCFWEFSGMKGYCCSVCVEGDSTEVEWDIVDIKTLAKCT